MSNHTVEKIGGTSMKAFEDVMNNILVGTRKDDEFYNRIFVVSAYAGITDMLLEHKKSGKPGVFALFSDAESDWAWGDALSQVCDEMCKLNEEIFKDDPYTLQQADQFVKERVEGVRSCLIDLHRLCSYGHFQLENHMSTVREMLSAIGEAHSAHNTSLRLQQAGVNAQFVDLTGWREVSNPDFESRIREVFDKLDLSKELPIVTGYARCQEGIMRTYDRGYSEITFSKIATVTQAREAIIHKEYHLSSADPRIVAEEKVVPIGRTNYDVADQLSNLGMEAVHPSAAKGLYQSGIPLRVKNTFEPEHMGTLIDSEYKSDEPCVEIIAGRKGVYAVEFFEQDMVRAAGHDIELLKILARHKVKVVTKDINGNTITHYIAASLKTVKRICKEIEELYPTANMKVHRIAIVSAIGSDMNVPGLLARTVSALGDANINILATHQNMRQVDIQFVVEEEDYEKAIVTLHERLIEGNAECGPLKKLA